MRAPRPRKLWDVWRQEGTWIVQGPKARVHFNSRKTALAVAKRAKELDAIEAAKKAGAQ
jgi:hypothetical protein